MEIKLIGFTPEQEKSFWKEAKEEVGITPDLKAIFESYVDSLTELKAIRPSGLAWEEIVDRIDFGHSGEDSQIMGLAKVAYAEWREIKGFDPLPEAGCYE